MNKILASLIGTVATAIATSAQAREIIIHDTKDARSECVTIEHVAAASGFIASSMKSLGIPENILAKLIIAEPIPQGQRWGNDPWTHIEHQLETMDPYQRGGIENVIVQFVLSCEANSYEPPAVDVGLGLMVWIPVLNIPGGPTLWGPSGNLEHIRRHPNYQPE